MPPQPSSDPMDLEAATAMSAEMETSSLQSPEKSIEPGVQSDPDAWRGELSERLNRYRARRKIRPPRYPSLSLHFGPFEPVIRSDSGGSETPTGPYQPMSEQALALDGTRHDSFAGVESVVEAPPPITIPAESPRAKIIEFPRFAWAPPAPPPDQLAEPVSDAPRILEVPDSTPPPPALGGITIEPAEQQEIERRLGFDIPLQSAPLGRRMIAAAMDGAIISVASVWFGAIFWKITGFRPPLAHLLALGAAVLCVLWAAYQYLLIVYSGSTPGLRIAKLDLSRFDGSRAPKALRRWRVLASFLSAASLAMGYAWVFLDEDSLCWHDRITRTYLAPRVPADNRP